MRFACTVRPFKTDKGTPCTRTWWYQANRVDVTVFKPSITVFKNVKLEEELYIRKVF